MALDEKSGVQVRQAVERYGEYLLEKVNTSSPFSRNKTGQVLSVSAINGYTVLIDNKKYINVMAISGDEIKVNDTVICLVPNNQMSQIFILGKFTTKNDNNKLPSGGTAGQYLAKRSNADYAVEWVTAGNLPSGGEQGQILRKRSGSNYDTEWTDDQVPNGGTEGQTLIKNSSTNKDASWGTNFSNGLQINGLQINGSQASSLDLNTIAQAGFYGLKQATNVPSAMASQYGEMIVFGYRTSNNWVQQLLAAQGDDGNTPGTLFTRASTSANGGSWQDWSALGMHRTVFSSSSGVSLANGSPVSLTFTHVLSRYKRYVATIGECLFMGTINEGASTSSKYLTFSRIDQNTSSAKLEIARCNIRVSTTRPSTITSSNVEANRFVLTTSGVSVFDEIAQATNDRKLFKIEEYD